MMFIIFDTKQPAVALNNRITSDLKPKWTDEITNNYCDILKHPTQDLWAIIIQPGYENYFTQSELNAAQELTPDWIIIPEV